MKVYIVQEIKEYSIYKVPDNLVSEFEAEKKEVIVAEGKSIAEVIMKFDAIEKRENFEFNTQLQKYKTLENENLGNDKNRQRNALKIRR